jgi:hypothetical protein
MREPPGKPSARARRQPPGVRSACSRGDRAKRGDAREDRRDDPQQQPCGLLAELGAHPVVEGVEPVVQRVEAVVDCLETVIECVEADPERFLS